MPNRCGSKRRNHQCGLGLCHDDIEEELDEFIPMSTKFLRGKRKQFDTTDHGNEDKEINRNTPTNVDDDRDMETLHKKKCKTCNKCGRPIKGHSPPTGLKCSLEPLNTYEDIQSEKQMFIQEKCKTCNNCGRPIKGHSPPTGLKCSLEPLNTYEDIQSEKQMFIQEKCKTCNKCGRPIKGHSPPTGLKCSLEPLNTYEDIQSEKQMFIQEKDRNKKKSEEAKNKCKARKKKERERKQASKNYFGWTKPSEKNPTEKHILDNMTETCINCGAKMFPWERSKKEDDGLTFSLCCSYGSVKLAPFKDPSLPLKKLFERNSSQSRKFLDNIRKYNGLVAMSSKNISGKLTDFSKCKSRGPNVYKMSGQMYHLIPNMFNIHGKKPKFSQIYVYDNECEDNEVETRLTHTKKNEKNKIDKETLKIIQAELRKKNPYISKFRSAAKIFRENPEKKLKMVIKAKGSIGAKKRKQNPAIQDVVVVAPGDQTEPRDVVLYRTQADHPKGNDTVRINENHFMYDPTAYPLILPFGDDGFSIDHTYSKKNLTALEFYRFHMQVRDGFNTLLKSRRLYQEWLCDMWSKIEGSRLTFIRSNQDKLRIEQYSGLQDSLSLANSVIENKNPQATETEKAKIGQMIVLPASFTSSPRYMYSHYLDALAIAREFTRFTLFITMTGNPKWEAVQENLFNGQQAFDRPDIMNRVFYKMLHDLLDDLKKGALGPLKAWLHTIEGQFRCLKHAHILLLLTIQLNVEDIDQIISAQIPDPDEKPELYKCVSQYMLHGPCGPGYPNAPCMEKGVCSKGYPKDFEEETKLPHDGHGYPLYARPDNGRVIDKNGFLFDNRWVVPHNEFLLVKFDCHTNVEFIGSFLTIKYIYKYVHKGVDVSTIGIENMNDKDEVTRFINARTIDPYDAHWRISEYRVQERFPAVQKLAIHTDGQHQVIFKEGHALEAMESAKDTTLMAYFKLNQEDEEARQYKYQDIPKYFTWNENKWTKRKKQPIDGEVPRTIGRINNVSPVQGERFYLRILLNHIKGARSFDELKLYNGDTFDTYKETCLAMGLLEDDSEWMFSLGEISVSGSAKQMRSSFAVILQYCRPSEPRKIFEHFQSNMSDDFIYNTMKTTNCSREAVDDEVIKNHVLLALDEELSDMGGSIKDFPDMPQPVALTEEEREARLIQEEHYDVSKQMEFLNTVTPLLNAEQATLCDSIYKAVHSTPDEKRRKLFILNSPGGYGKTFVLKAISAKIRSEGGIVICVASTGLAAQNLEGGRTAHSRFKIPIDILEDSTCSIKAQSALAKLIKLTRLVIWDEVFSCHRYNVEAVERTFRDILNVDETFGDKVFCFGGDPRQTLPVIRRGGRAQIARACIQMSPLYCLMEEHRLSQNMRTDPEEIEFSDYILRIGNGEEEVFEDSGENVIKIPDNFLVDSREALIESIFPDLEFGSENVIDGCIYTPLNRHVHVMNDICIDKYPGTAKSYLSADSILEDDHKDAVPNEYLNAMSPSGLPDHNLTLKVGAPIMLLRNLQAGSAVSLRNGTRMVVIQMMERALEVEVAVGINKGLRIFLPRIPHYDKSGDYPFTIVRRQLPVRLAFSVTINKGQGQENERVGLYLPSPVFAHGQLYTGISRGKRSSMVKVRISDDEEGLTDNIVYKELLT